MKLRSPSKNAPSSRAASSRSVLSPPSSHSSPSSSAPITHRRISRARCARTASSTQTLTAHSRSARPRAWRSSGSSSWSFIAWICAHPYRRSSDRNFSPFFSRRPSRFIQATSRFSSSKSSTSRSSPHVALRASPPISHEVIRFPQPLQRSHFLEAFSRSSSHRASHF